MARGWRLDRGCVRETWLLKPARTCSEDVRMKKMPIPDCLEPTYRDRNQKLRTRNHKPELDPGSTDYR
jgi:hypothetical protein